MDTQQTNKLARTVKDIVVKPQRSTYANPSIINREFYNSFNFSRLPGKYKHLNLTLGITSPNKGEGKTLVASNLAASFALGYKRKTVLVDLNIQNPCIHEVFGASLSPGVTDSFQNGDINLVQTKFEQLFVFPAGNGRTHPLDLHDVIPIRDVIYTLEQKFEFVIVDMGSILNADFPSLFANEVDGLLAVIDSQNTKNKDVKKMYRYVNEKQILGYIFNRMDDKE